MQSKYLFITGGVVSSLGKGITVASIAQLLEARGIRVAILKLDPYLNVDPGTMNPFQHGEVYVTNDGAETDLDLGHYYRFTKSPLSRASNSTSGQIYDTVIKKERKGEYLGATVQVIPHVTDEIKARILACQEQSKDTQVVLIEIGGTVGDIESLPFLEAIRQFRGEHPKDCLNLHLTYVPYLKAAGEVKTKPSQHSVQVLREIGIVPDFILCRSEVSLSEEIKKKLSLFCSVEKDRVIEEKDVEHSIYEVPLELHNQKLDEKICDLLNLKAQLPDLSAWKKMLDKVLHPKKTLRIGVVGKYMDHQDAYKSVFEALEHGAIASNAKVEIVRIESDQLLEKELQSLDCDGYLVPGGFGQRGWDGKLQTAKHCRVNHIPYFGICLGMQVMVVEFARNVLELKDAHSTEVDITTENPVICLLSEQEKIQDLGGTMRLGAYPCELKEKSLAQTIYGKKRISERHRHRYEMNPSYQKKLEEKGLMISGTLEKNILSEIVEIPSHPWMLGVQFHPEFQSRPLEPHPLFVDFIKAALIYKQARESSS